MYRFLFKAAWLFVVPASATKGNSGTACQQRCVHGSCHGDILDCSLGWYGEDCSYFLLADESESQRCPYDCSGRGTCRNGKCTCYQGWSALDCSEKDTSTCLDNCNAPNGKCNHGNCACANGFTGLTCSEKTCPNDCNEQGDCVNGKCECSHGWSGFFCNVKLMTSASCTPDCKNKGLCYNNRCFCSQGWTGKDCSLAIAVKQGGFLQTVSKHTEHDRQVAAFNKRMTQVKTNVTAVHVTVATDTNITAHNVTKVSNTTVSHHAGLLSYVENLWPLHKLASMLGKPKNQTKSHTTTPATTTSTTKPPPTQPLFVDDEKELEALPPPPPLMVESPVPKPSISPNKEPVPPASISPTRSSPSKKTTIALPQKSSDDTNQSNVVIATQTRATFVSVPSVSNTKRVVALSGEKTKFGDAKREVTEAILAATHSIKDPEVQKSCLCVRGTCLEDGSCECEPEFQGKYCDLRRCKDDCNERGQCMLGRCICEPEWFGDSCEKKRCPNDCSFKGSCHDGSCICKPGFLGDDCATNQAPQEINTKLEVVPPKTPENIDEIVDEAQDARANGCPGNCNKNGVCSGGACTCFTGYTGGACENFCPNFCSMRGECVNGACLCLAGFIGADCSIPGCCNGNGSCELPGLCICNAGWMGASCGIAMSCKDPKCGGNGKCKLGKCECFPGWIGESCGEAHCNPDCAPGCTCNKETLQCQCPPALSSVPGPPVMMTHSFSLMPSGRQATVEAHEYPLPPAEEAPLADGDAAQSLDAMMGADETVVTKPTVLNVVVNPTVMVAPNTIITPPAQDTAAVTASTSDADSDMETMLELSCGADNLCSNHGTCNHERGMCNCNDGWHKFDCSIQRCPNFDGVHECSGHGLCVDGACQCAPGWGLLQGASGLNVCADAV